MSMKNKAPMGVGPSKQKRKRTPLIAWIGDARLGFASGVIFEQGWYTISTTSRGAHGTGERTEKTHRYDSFKLAVRAWSKIVARYLAMVGKFDRFNHRKKSDISLPSDMEAIYEDTGLGSGSLVKVQDGIYSTMIDIPVVTGDVPVLTVIDDPAEVKRVWRKVVEVYSRVLERVK